MKLTTDELKNLKDLVKELDGTVRSYSGRCMYGKNCLGVTLSHEMVFPFFYQLGISSLHSFDTGTWDQLISNTKQDSMGLDTIIYWPRLEYDATQEVEDCEFCGCP